MSEQNVTEKVVADRIVQPAVDLFETKNGVLVLLDMPGVTTDYLDVDLEDGILTVEGSSKSSTYCGGGSCLAEFGAKKYRRQFQISEDVDVGKIEATLKNGELRIVLPKSERVKPKKVNVKVDN